MANIIKPTVAAGKRVIKKLTDIFDDSYDLNQVPNVPQITIERYEPPKGPSARVLDLLDNKSMRRNLSKTIDKGAMSSGPAWYNSEPLRAEFINELGEEEGNKAFLRYMEYVSASSPRSKVPENIRNGSFYYVLERGGLPMPEVGTRNPVPYGHMAQKLHQMNAERVAGDGWDVLNNPKPPSFSANLSGNQLPVTVDAHATKLPALLAKDPRWLDTTVRVAKPKEAGGGFENIKPQKMFEAGELSLKDALNAPTFWVGQPRANEYLALEEMYRGIGKRKGLTGAQTQASAWVGGGDVTGLGSPSEKTFMDMFIDRVETTANMRGESPKQVLKDFIRGNKPLLSAAPIGGFTAAISGEDDNAD